MAHNEVIKAFHRVSERKELVRDREIFLKEIDDLFEELSAELPDIEMSRKEIQDEINAYRNERKRHD